MTELYKPPGSVTLDQLKDKPQIRLGIQGYGGTGKTWSALTFPNPIVLNLDRGLGAHIGRSDVIEIPFYKKEFSGVGNELKDRLMTWLDKEARKLNPEQTLVFDGCTSLQNAYHRWFEDNKMSFLTKGGKVDDFAEYMVKKNILQRYLNCSKFFNVMLFLFHMKQLNVTSQRHQGQPGEYTGKIRPLLTGQFNDELLSHMTDWFRQHANDKPDLTIDIKPATLQAFGMTQKEFIEMCNSFPRNTLYYWQSDCDSTFDGKCSSLVNFPRYLKADYSSFLKYTRKQNI